MRHGMALLVGATLAFAAGLLATASGLDRDRASYPTVAIVIALGAHGVFDLAHGAVPSNPGVPGWWPAFCLTYDATAAGYLAWSLTSGRIRAGA
jgi:hypothetical protein